ncbi:Zn-ribbon domain-containing OB-fold protein [Dermatobacter hominis]|uniref:Zn-ribbon domain-containing OB-fold protein n=1 Tax=Dermatobacter hominis TaxID=2884263 RepID=UPI001D12527E|nr:OB-fold domain-containing protein [Dermatobacter hominis]UDY36664.1 OB-fold domain-containing protein [Dermatobacter hominis]
MGDTVAQVPFAPEVFTWPSDEPQLIGGRCADCGSVTFPRPPSCARCGSTSVDEHLLPRTGTLWTFTTQGFLPKEPYKGGETPESFVPFGVGLVQLGDEVRVESRLTENDPERLRIGMPLELVVVPFRTDPDGTEVMTFAFSPSTGGA